jgi:hypothetical protein
MSTRSTVQAFLDPRTWTVSYGLADCIKRRAAIIDPVLDYDFKSGHTSTVAAARRIGKPRLPSSARRTSVRAGQMPPPDDDGVAYLRIPLNTLPLRK